MRMLGCGVPGERSGSLRICRARPGHPRRGRSAPASASYPQQDTLDTELTRQENLWVYGRFFGLPRAEVRARADELLEFAQLDRRRRQRSGRQRSAAA
jgi:lipooligosaccharide transport system ATP-binding protein